MPVFRRAWFADHSPGNGFFVASVNPPPNLMVDTFNSGTVNGPVPTGVTASQKFAFSMWYDVAQIPLINFNLSASAVSDLFTIGNIGLPFAGAVTFHRVATGNGSMSNTALIGVTPPVGTGFVNTLISGDMSGTPVLSVAHCFTDLGPPGDISSNTTVYNGPGTTIPFDLTPNNSPPAWALHSAGELADGPFIDWVALIIGTYYDFTNATNRRLFNVACAGNATLAPVDPTSLGPQLLLHGGASAFFTNRIDNSIWTNNPVNPWTDVAGIPPCP